MRVALYLRRSTLDLQPESLVVQEEVLRAHAAAHDLLIVDVFRDSASGRSSKRKDFQRLVQVIDAGAPFQAVLVRDVSRFGRFAQPDEHAYWEFRFLLKGVRVLYVDEPFPDESSPYAVLMKDLKRVLASEFSREKAVRTSESQARVVTQGFVHGGTCPYGLRRTLVGLDGAYAGELPRGERKLVSTHRVKFALGKPNEVSVVRRIFDLYGGGTNSPQIADLLNQEGVSPPRGRRWYVSQIIRILYNAAYIGTQAYVRGQNDSVRGLRDGSKSITSCTNAFPAIITPDVWEQVQERLRERTWNKTNEDLVEDLRRAYLRWGCAIPPEVTACWQTYGNRFPGGHQEAMRQAFATEIRGAVEALREALSHRVRIEEREEGWLVNGHLRVTLQVSFPQPRFRSLRWQFRIDDQEADVILGLGFSPPPVTHVETFVFNLWKCSRRRMIYPSLSRQSWPAHHAPRTIVEIARALSYATYGRSTEAQEAVLEQLKTCRFVNIAALARTLGWPYHLTRTVYRKLLHRNPILATQVKRPGRRIEIACSSCGSRRRYTPYAAFQLVTDLCQACTYASKRVDRIEVICPSCGATRQLLPSVVKKLSNGTRTQCHACMLSTGRDLRQEALRKRRPIEAMKNQVLWELAERVAQAMRASNPTAKVWHVNRAAPSIHWRDSDGARCRLTLHASEEVLLKSQHALAALIPEIVSGRGWQADRPSCHSDRSWLRQVA